MRVDNFAASLNPKRPNPAACVERQERDNVEIGVGRCMHNCTLNESPTEGSLFAPVDGLCIFRDWFPRTLQLVSATSSTLLKSSSACRPQLHIITFTDQCIIFQQRPRDDARSFHKPHCCLTLVLSHRSRHTRGVKTPQGSDGIKLQQVGHAGLCPGRVLYRRYSEIMNVVRSCNPISSSPRVLPP